MDSIQLIQKSTNEIDLSYKDQDGNPIDLTGVTVFFTVKRNFSEDSTDSDALIKKSITVHTDPSQGLTKVSLSSSDMDIATGSYLWDTQLIDGSSVIWKTPYSKFEVIDSVTNRIT